MEDEIRCPARSKPRLARTRPGTIVVVDFPFPNGEGSKVRPALVLQRFGPSQDPRFVLAMITSNTSRVDTVRSHVLLDPCRESHSGLVKESAIDLGELTTVTESRVISRRGFIKESLLTEVRGRMKEFLSLS